MTFLGKQIVASTTAMRNAAMIYFEKHGTYKGFGIVTSPEFYNHPLDKYDQ